MEFETFFIQPFGFAITCFAAAASGAGAFLLNLAAQSAQRGAVVRPRAWIATTLALIGCTGGAVSFTGLQLDTEQRRLDAAEKSVREIIDGSWRAPGQTCADARHFITQAPDRVRVVTDDFPEDQQAFKFGINSVILTENNANRTRYRYTRTSPTTMSQQMKDGNAVGLEKCSPN